MLGDPDLRRFVLEALDRGDAKDHIRSAAADHGYAADAVEQALEPFPEPALLRRYETWNRLLLGLVGAAMLVKFLMLLALRADAATHGLDEMARATFYLFLGWLGLFIMLMVLILRGAAHGYLGMIGFTAGSIGYAATSITAAFAAGPARAALASAEIALAAAGLALAFLQWKRLHLNPRRQAAGAPAGGGP